METYGNLPGNNIQIYITQNDLRPDLIQKQRKERRIHMIELICSFETNIEAAYARKYRKYTDLE